MPSIAYRDTGGFVRLSDLAPLMQMSLDDLEAWLAGATQPTNVMGVYEINGVRVARKSVVMRDWYDALWIRTLKGIPHPMPAKKRVEQRNSRFRSLAKAKEGTLTHYRRTQRRFLSI